MRTDLLRLHLGLFTLHFVNQFLCAFEHVTIVTSTLLFTTVLFVIVSFVCLFHPSDFNIIIRDDNSRQWAYKGQPLYYFVKDGKPGDKTGDGVGGAWKIARP